MIKKMGRKIAVAMATALALASTLGVATFADDEWHSDQSEEIYAGGSYGYMTPSTDSVQVQVGGTNSVSVDVYGGQGAIDIAWVSYDTSVVTVSPAGNSCNLYGVSQGSAQVAAQLYINGAVADVDTFTVNVGYFDGTPQGGNGSYVGVTGIQTNRGTNITMKVGEAANCEAYVTPSNANNKRIEYSSNNNNVARVDGDGCIIAVNPGVCCISAITDENRYQVNYAVTVNPAQNNGYVAVQGISLDPNNATVGVGQSFMISPTIFPVNATNKNAYWNSTNPNIVRVDNNGKVTGLQVGTATISCTTQDGSKVAYCQVNVIGSSTGVVTSNVTRNAQFTYQVVSQIIAAGPNATVTIQTPNAMSYDSSVAQALAGRRDVTLVAIFPYGNCIYSMTLPAGYNLAAQLDNSGYVEWMILATKPGVILNEVH